MGAIHMIPTFLFSGFLLCFTVCMKDYQSRLAVHELGGIPPLLELLKSDFPVIQHLALKTLQNLTTDKDTRNTFRQQQGFEKLMDILSSTVCVCRKNMERVITGNGFILISTCSQLVMCFLSMSLCPVQPLSIFLFLTGLQRPSR